MASKNASLKTLLDSVVTELMIKTTGDQVYLDSNTTLAAKIAEMVTAINARAKTSDVNTLVSNLRQELLGDTPVEAYNTFTELAQYIEEHQEAADALSTAIGNKADKSTVTTIQNTLAGLGSLAKKSTVTESDLDSSLKDKVNAASDGNHSHSNKNVLDGITATNVTAWNGKANIYVSATQPSGLTSADLWIDIS